MFDAFAFQSGVISFLLAFLTALAFALVFKVVYQWVTPYREGELIRGGNTAAAVALGGALIGYVIPLVSALANTTSLAEFAAWAAVAAVIQIVAFTLVRHLMLPNVKARIEAGDMAAGVYLMSISLAVGLLNAACMTA